VNLDHTIVPSNDNDEAARFFARIFGLPYEGPSGVFAPVRINETLTLDFYNQNEFGWHHYAFHVSEDEFDEILGRIHDEDIPFGDGPQRTDSGEIGSPFQGGRTVYFRNADDHIFEFMTVPQTGAT
jgi:catechol 2,3-dioxygenase-like lactoylglutathione lyase family enzyme